MDLSFTIYLLLFMSVGLALYFVVPKKYRFVVVLIESVVFYALYSKFMTIFIVLTVATIYLVGLWLNTRDDAFDKQKETLDKEQKKALKKKIKTQKKWIAAFGIFVVLGMLVGLKYTNFFASMFDGVLGWFNVSAKMPVLKIILPLGISYYTLSAIGYVVDVCRGKYKGDQNFCRVALFVMYFPQLLEGPFATYDKLAPQLYNGSDFDSKRISSGFLLVLWGFFKKIVVADRMAIIAGEVFKNYSQYSGIIVVVGVVCFTIQLYAEFSGIIDVVRGISEMYGFNLAKNFEQPFFSQSINEFWRRWHMSLGAWFREYIFYPISMSKGFMKLNKKLHGKVNSFFEVFIPSLLALFVVWVLNGLWHGPELKYVVYGLYYYVLMMIGMCFEPLFNWLADKTKISRQHWTLKVLRIVRTLVLVNIGLMMFRAKSLVDFGNMFAGMFSYAGKKSNLLAMIDVFDLVVMLIGFALIVVVDFLEEYKIHLREKFTNSNLAVKYATILVFAVVLIVFGAYGDGYIPVDPIYGGF